MGWLGHEKLATTLGAQWNDVPWGWLTICGLFFWAGYLVWDWTSSAPRLRVSWPWSKISIQFAENFAHSRISDADFPSLFATVKFRRSLKNAGIHASISYLIGYIDGTVIWSDDSDVLIKKIDGDNPTAFHQPVYLSKNERIGGPDGRLESGRYIGSLNNWHQIKRGYTEYKIKVKVITGGKVYEKSVLIFDPNHTWSVPVIIDIPRIERFLLMPKGANAIGIGDKEAW